MAYGTANVDVIQSSTAGTAPTFKDGNGTETGTLCRAWVNFNGTGTVAIRASFNVSSITDNGTGDYTINFTNAMPDTNYAVAGMADSYATGQSYSGCVMINKSSTYSTSAVRVVYGFGNGPSIYDTEKICVAVFR